MRVYVIDRSEYADQTWGPVFSTMEKAIAYVESLGKENDDARIEVCAVDDENDTGYTIKRADLRRHVPFPPG